MYRNGTFRRIFDLLQRHKFIALALGAAVFAPACSASLRDSTPPETDRQKTSERMEKSVNDPASPINRRFRTLDEYLAFLEQTQGPVDGPWYKQIRPDVFELQTGNLHLDTPGGEKRVFTRAELEKKFGFSR